MKFIFIQLKLLIKFFILDSSKSGVEWRILDIEVLTTNYTSFDLFLCHITTKLSDKRLAKKYLTFLLLPKINIYRNKSE